MEIKYIDTHAHLNLEQFANDRVAVFDKCNEEGVGIINVGTKKSTSKLGVQLGEKYKNAKAIVGLHPLTVIDPNEDKAEPVFDYDFYKPLAECENTVGIGECGFDYFHYGDESYKQQREVFLAQIHLANEVGKPLMLHLRNNKVGLGRNAYDDALEILKNETKVLGNAHFYAGSILQAQAFFELGFTISFTGVITFTSDYDEIVKYAPLSMIHAETDCPYVAPVPYRGRRCEPWMVKEVYKKIAEIKKENEEEVREQLLKNAKNLYRI